ncbi:ABC transporter [Pueribacillus theae]|uniref:ABC transporter n=1 Tax=Pueribacillus theae TaxID=2171751 RepID=A0A2U1JS12_9BACI|nr:ABC transporter ATP-binding protein [Pueribacillus theae]PWA07912.1 ABC transporter [Pueribacillus theae]
MNVIKCKDLVKKYGNTKALDGLSFHIEENKITGLIGRNGAGKTTLLKIIAGFFQETSGEISVFGERPFNSLYVSANSIYINDEMTFPSTLRLSEILDAASQFYEKWDAQLAERLFDYFSFRSNQYHNNLSKGMKSTFNMIVGLSSRCALTIFDEPTTGMDAAVRSDFYRALLKDYIDYPRSIIISSHHLNEIEHLLEDLLLLKDGKVNLHLSITELKEWAIGIQGDAMLIDEWAKDKEIIHLKDIGTNRQYVVVRNNFTDSELRRARLAGLDISSVDPSDLCVYLTNKNKGGIDDVFRKAESFN